MSKDRDKYYYEFDYIAYYYVLPFINRWKRKVKKGKKDEDDKVFVFDKFIVNYIIYSSLVNVIKPQQLKHKSDCKYCTAVMANYIIERIDDPKTFLQSLDECVINLIRAIKTYHLSVVSSTEKNPELDKNWESKIPIQQLKSLLETLYYIRCNLFHGNKEYSDCQIALLKPAHICLSMINKQIEALFAINSKGF